MTFDDIKPSEQNQEGECIKDAPPPGTDLACAENSCAEGLRAPDDGSVRNHQVPDSHDAAEAPLPNGMACVPEAEKPLDRSSSTLVPTGKSLDPSPCANQISKAEVPVDDDGSRQGMGGVQYPNGCDNPVVDSVSIMDGSTSVLTLNGVGGDHAHDACAP